ncbi:MAG: T9SS type A sorting domain-containing protein [bacterium]|nr:MAG: T9SS type A sorting domain-containing protein [bacterium]
MRSLKLLSSICLILLFGTCLAFSQESVSYKISWYPVSDPSVDLVLIYRSLTVSITDYVLIDSVSTSNNHYIDEGMLDYGVRYYYRLKSKSTASGISSYSAQVSGLTLHESSPNELKNLCKIDSVRSVDSNTFQVYWSTEWTSTGVVEYWRSDEQAQVTTRSLESGTRHITTLSGLEVDDIYFARAKAYDSQMNMTISCVFPFSTEPQGPGNEDIYFVVSTDSVYILENETSDIGIKLSAQPDENVEVSVFRTIGDQDITVMGSGSLTFTTGNWDQYQFVTLSAAEDADIENGDAVIFIRAESEPLIPDEIVIATEVDNDALNFLTSSASVSIPEGGTAEIGVRLSKIPIEDIEVSVEYLSGDQDLSIIDGGSLTFTSTNWNVYHTVTIAAAEDPDNIDGEAVIRIHGVSGGIVPDRDFIAVEIDNDEDDPYPDLGSEPITFYPNPYRIEYGVLKVKNLPSDGSLEIYDLRGRRAWDISWSGQNNIEWDGSNKNATYVSSGRYFVVIKDGSGNVIDKRAILVLR